MCVCVTWTHDGPVHVGLTESTERMNGIRPTCVIQLACGRELCPHPSARRDKEVGKRRVVNLHIMKTSDLILKQNYSDFTQNINLLFMGSTTHSVSKKITLMMSSAYITNHEHGV